MLTSTLPRWVGDAEPRFVLDLARALAQNFEIEVIAPHAPGADLRETMEGMQVLRYRYWWPRWQGAAYEGGMVARIRENPLRALQLPFFFLALGWTVFRRLRREPRVDLVHAHWVIPQGLAALIARRLCGRTVPVLCTSHGGDLFGLKGRLLSRLKSVVLERCDGVTVVSSALAGKARDLAPPIEPIVIPMGTDLEATFTPPPSPRSPPLRRLLFAGRLVPKKGVSHLLEAMARLRTSFPDATLTIAGDGPLLSDLKAQAGALNLEGVVTFAGPIPHARLAELYRKADIAVFPFVEAADGDQEGFGLVMVEAMGCGCAVVASDLPAVRDVIRPGETGFLVPPGDAEALAARIASMVREPEATLALGARGTAHALGHFDWKVTAERFVSVYRQLIELSGLGAGSGPGP